MQATLSGRVAIVTGAGRGLGQEVACRLAAAGAQVVLVARTIEQLRQTAENISQQGGTALVVAADIRREAEQLGAEAESYRAWVRWVDETGGDPPAKAADLVLKLASDEAADVTGQFLWIADGLQAPIASWDAPEDARCKGC